MLHQYCASRFLPWVPGLVPLAHSASKTRVNALMALAALARDTSYWDLFVELGFRRRLRARRRRRRGDGHADEAHQLKGAAETFGLCQFADLANTLEFCAPTITPQDYAALLDRLDACFERSRKQAAAAVATALAS